MSVRPGFLSRIGTRPFRSLFSIAALAAAGLLQAGDAAARAVAFRNVNVVTMRGAVALPGQTVVVDGRRIVALGSSRAVRVPKGATIIDGRNRYLMPGLVDAHVHIFDRDERWLFLANGITTIANWHGTPRHLEWRAAWDRQAEAGPRLVTAGAIMDGIPPTRPTNVVVRDADAALAEAARQKMAGYDYLKTYDNISFAALQALRDFARANGMSITGHVPLGVGLDRFLSLAPQMRAIQHLEELLPFTGDGDPAQVRGIARKIARTGMYVIPTYDVMDGMLRHLHGERGDWSLVSPETVADWRWEQSVVERKARGPSDRSERMAKTLPLLLRELHRQGVKIVAGTDSPIPTVAPGALAGELALYRAAGLSNFEVLKTATVNAASFLQRPHGGVIATGADADLVLLGANPLTTLGALKSVEGVMVQGHYYPKALLQAEVERLRQRYARERADAKPQR